MVFSPQYVRARLALWCRRLELVLIHGVRNAVAASLLGRVCKYSRSPRLRRRIGEWLHHNIGEHFAKLAPSPKTSPAVVVHALGNVTIMEATRYSVHADDDDVFEQNLTMTIVRMDDHVIVYNPIPLSSEQLRQHVWSEAAATQYWVVLPSVYHHLYADGYLAFLPRERVTVVGAVSAGKRHVPPLCVLPASALRVPGVRVLTTSIVGEEINLVIPHQGYGTLLLVCHLFQCRGMAHFRFRERQWALRALEAVIKVVDAFDDRGCLDLFFWAHMTDAADCEDSFRALRALEGVVGVVCAHGGMCDFELRELFTRQLSWL